MKETRLKAMMDLRKRKKRNIIARKNEEMLKNAKLIK